jgi:hypothetical protein
MTEPANPYKHQPKKAFWRPAVADLHLADIADLWTPIQLRRNDKVATAGSCFAQHIGRHLKERGANYLDLEPPPPFLSERKEEARFGYGTFSCRYGNIYTSRQLIQLFDECFGRRAPTEVAWARDDRFVDALRPGVDPVGQDSPKIVLELRRKHLIQVQEMFRTLDVFVFTLGLTEGWEATTDGTMYPLAPGTSCGHYDPSRYAFHNLKYAEIAADLTNFYFGLKEVNPDSRLLLTVSPVPLTATATPEHVLVATAYSKSTLRAVAGDMAASHPDVFYFPSYEIVATHPARGMLFNPDLRTVNDIGVRLVMSHFFSGPLAEEFPHPQEAPPEEFELVCDEEELDRER